MSLLKQIKSNIPDAIMIYEATAMDVDDITTIWRQGVLEQGAAANEDHLKVDNLKKDFRHQIEQQNENFKFWICLYKDTIVGWRSILPFHVSPNPVVKSGFGQSSTYVKKEFQGKGIGKMLLDYALDYCKNHSNLKYVFGIVLTDNKKSLKMCDEIGFYNMGTLPKVQNAAFPEWDFLVYQTK
ncbi:GNAT family N-acetyltransferase [Niabella drilacis]|uniref:L-amino acid N-acyltransferase YncA n=1 Tax=Niabella drilacis (strain DSM 25811 / CCM 8410 / CCUG 62505 / LMG 26954 / E90) TaxID=1285928 RepID=A0A1G7BWP4_NIADE|nr:GNAT family N-acetyltransferase [Niabella drilacis]SDE31477.1 L-amino acid N-acyltransferase YncA [Niabella drilacis]